MQTDLTLPPERPAAASHWASRFDARYGWHALAAADATVWFRGHVHGRTMAEIAGETVSVAGRGPKAVAAWLDGLNGHFSLFASGDNWALAASDPVRTYPLNWSRDNKGRLLVDPDGPRLAARLGLGAGDIDGEMARAFALSGFTIGDGTLYAPIGQVGPGMFLFASDDEVALHRYHRWKPWQPGGAEYSDLVGQLVTVNQQLIDDLMTSANGRPIIVPLSAGLDSRFIVSGLVAAGYDNINTFSYGLAGNREAEVAREIAERLGVDWSFVPYSNRQLAEMFRSDDYQTFMAYSDSLTSIHFPQDYFALTEIRQRGHLADDAIMVNGQTGDFIAGNHIPASFTAGDPDDSEEVRIDRVLSSLLAKHYKHWQCLVTPDRMSAIRQLLENEIDLIGGLPDDPHGDHGLYEYCEFQDRQSKYVINGQRLYEYFGLQWRLPLWERRYLDFWEKAPLKAKFGEKLYRDVLERQNWGNVWRDIPLNPTRIRPGWIRPVRLAAKAACAPFGRATWHRFEKRFLDYFMATTSAYAVVPYSRLARDRRGHYSAIGWHIEAYLKQKGLAYDGTRRDD